MGKTQDTEKNRCLEADTEEVCAFPFFEKFPHLAVHVVPRILKAITAASLHNAYKHI